jgi:signal peptidase II
MTTAPDHDHAETDANASGQAAQGDAVASGGAAAAEARAMIETPAWRSQRAWIVLAVTVVVGLVADIGTKYAAFEWVAGSPVHLAREDVLAIGNANMMIPPHNPVTVVPFVLEFKLLANHGAVFGIGQGKRWFFILFTLLALAISLGMFAGWTSRRDHLAHMAIGLVLAGGVGNLYDRYFYAFVRDFIHPLPGVSLPFGLTWPSGSTDAWGYVSNVADLFLMIGIGILMFRALWPYRADRVQPAKAA